jgi:tetratricopeptide (TPR) repeat protein
MNLILRIASIVLPALLLAACAGTPGTTQPGLEVGDAGPDQVRPAPQTSRPVLALLEQANQAARQGDLAVAESRLERALRIEPRNPVLWNYMAKLRLHQGRLGEAAGLAAKSNSLANAGDRTLQADNWRIIAHARQRSGDYAAAREAEQKAAAIAAEQ